jgi:hypothetical protein
LSNQNQRATNASHSSAKPFYKDSLAITVLFLVRFLERQKFVDSDRIQKLLLARSATSFPFSDKDRDNQHSNRFSDFLAVARTSTKSYT